MSSAVASSSSHRLSDDATAATHSVHSALSPRIGVLSSPDVQASMEANHLSDFADLLKPFEDSIENITVRTSQLETRRCDSFPLSFDSLDTFAPLSASTSTSSLFTPADVVLGSEGAGSDTKPSQRAARFSRPELLLDAISARVSAKSKAVWENRNGHSSSSNRHSRKYSSLGGNESSLKQFLNGDDDGEADLERYRLSSIKNLTPWFADTKAMVLNTRNMSEHETFSHPLAILLVVSAHSSDPMNAFASLFEASQPHACRAFTHRPYVDPLVLRYYIVLHDVSRSGPDLTESTALLENVKKTYGLHCCLLSINSNSADGPHQNGERQASMEIADQWRKAYRNDRKAGRAGKADDVPPKVPPKQGQAEEVRPRMSVDDEEEELWYSEKELEGICFGEALVEDDVRRVKSFVRDFAAQSLIPFLERCVSLWNEQLTASRKGLTGRLFGAASRKFFSGGSGKGSSQGQAAASFAALGYYPHSSIEAQTRRLADFAFTTRDYRLAASMYDLGRRDYANDKAMKYIAGANEMFGLSHLMMMLSSRSTPIDVDSYLAAAGHHYLLSPRQKGSALQLDSLRATLLYYEVYRGLHYYRSAPFALVRTATEGGGDAENDLEVAGAMLLEQAAIADLRQSDRPALRKSALHLVMAAHRYRSCGQKHLSFRCFQGAASLYHLLKQRKAGQERDRDESGKEEGGRETRLAEHIARYEVQQTSEWDLIEDHMEQELGQQASSDGQISQAVMHFFTLLCRQKQSVFATQEESASKHERCLQDFLTCCKYLDTDLIGLLRTHNREPSLALVDNRRSSIRVRSTVHHVDEQWVLLEEQALGQAEGRKSQTVKAIQTATVDEPFWVELVLMNPLNTMLAITSLSVELWDDNGEKVEGGAASVAVVDDVQLAPLEQRSISVAISVNRPCQLRCTNVQYLLAGQVPFCESLLQRGRRLNETKDQRTSLESQYGPNDSLTVLVEEPKPRLEATLKDPVAKLGLGEEIETVIVVENKGRVGLKNAKVVVNRPDAIIVCSSTLAEEQGGEIAVENDLETGGALEVPLAGGVLAAGARMEWPVLLRGSALGSLTLRLLFVYETEAGVVLISQLQHTSQVEAVIDLAVQAGPTRTEDFFYNLKIDSINLCDAGEEETVTITALSFVSPAWKVVGGENDGLSSFSSMTHRVRQSTSTRLECATSSSAIKDMAYTVGQLQSLLTGRSTAKEARPGSTTVNASHLGDKDKAAISPFLFLARKEFRLSTLLQQYPSIRSTREIQRIFTLYEPSEVDVVAHWQLGKSKRRGQAFVFGLCLGPLQDHFEGLFAKTQDRYTRSLYAEAEKEKAALWTDVSRSRLHMEEDPVLFDVVGGGGEGDGKGETGDAAAATIQHTFSPSSNGRCVFPVHFLLRNLSTNRTRFVTLQLDNTIPSSTPLAVQASYVNRLTFRTTLAPHSFTRIQAEASVSRPGPVSLGPVLVKSTAGGDGGSQQDRSFQRWEHCTTPIKVT